MDLLKALLDAISPPDNNSFIINNLQKGGGIEPETPAQAAQRLYYEQLRQNAGQIMGHLHGEQYRDPTEVLAAAQPSLLAEKPLSQRLIEAVKGIVAPEINSPEDFAGNSSLAVVPPAIKALRKEAAAKATILDQIKKALENPTKFAGNDILHAKINERDFLVHSTTPYRASQILGGKNPILPSGDKIVSSQYLNKLKDTGELKLIQKGWGNNYAQFHNDKTRDIADALNLGPGKGPSQSPGVSLSRIPDLQSIGGEVKLLLDKSKLPPRFSTAEGGFKKTRYTDTGEKIMNPAFEFEERTKGTPISKKAIKGIVAPKKFMGIINEALDKANLPNVKSLQPELSPKKVNTLRARMGRVDLRELLQDAAKDTTKPESFKPFVKNADNTISLPKDKPILPPKSSEYKIPEVKKSELNWLDKINKLNDNGIYLYGGIPPENVYKWATKDIENLVETNPDVKKTIMSLELSNEKYKHIDTITKIYDLLKDYLK